MQHDLEAILDTAEQLEAAGNVDGALALLKSAADHKRNPQIDILTGSILVTAGRLREAAEFYTEACKHWPNQPELHFNRGNFLFNINNLAGAIACYRVVVALEPTHAKAHLNLAIAAASLGDWETSLSAARRATELTPEARTGWYLLIRSLSELHQSREACFTLHAYIKRQPSDANMLLDMGHLLHCPGLYSIAVETIETAIAHTSTLQRARLLVHHLGRLHAENGQTAKGLACMREGLRANPDDRGAHLALLSQMRRAAAPTESLIDELKRFQQRHYVLRPLQSKILPLPSRRLRLGILSGSLYWSPVSLLTLHAFEHLPEHQFEIIVFRTLQGHEDQLTARFKKIASGWHEVGKLSDSEAAKLIHRECIDILIDLTGHALPSFVLAHRPAPIQIKWIGNWEDSLSLQEIDYIIAGPEVTPAEQQSVDGSGKFLRMPGAHVCYLPAENTPPKINAPVLKHGFITFGHCGEINNLSSETITLWAHILQKVPSSRLVLRICSKIKDSAEHLRECFKIHGIAPERLEFRIQTTPTSSLDDYTDIDIALTPIPDRAELAACEALWLGIPVVALSGRSHESSYAASYLSALELKNWIASTAEEYVAIAKRLATTPSALDAVRADIQKRAQISPIFNGSSFARIFAQKLHCIWKDWCMEQNTDKSIKKLWPSPPIRSIISVEDAKKLAGRLPGESPLFPLHSDPDAAEYLVGDSALAQLPDYKFNAFSFEPASLSFLKEEIKRLRPKTILEFGSGISTCVLSTCQREVVGEDSHPLYISIDQEQSFANETLKLLEKLEIKTNAQVHVVPIERVCVHHFDSYCYGISEEFLTNILNGRTIDMVVIDGPFSQLPKPTGSSRLCTVPLIRSRLAPGAGLYMDDALRNKEIEIAVKWGELNYLDIAGILPIGKGLLVARANSHYN